MSINLIPLIIGILISLIPFVGLIVLQIFLSKMEKDWPGLILPILAMSGTILFSLISISFVFRGGIAIITLLILFLLFIVPSVVFFLIYITVHKKLTPKKELDKMTIQDLG